MTDDAELEHSREVHRFINGRAVHQLIKFDLPFRTSKTYVFHLPLTEKSKVEFFINATSPVILQVGKCGWTSFIGPKKSELFELDPDIVKNLVKNSCIKDRDLVYVEVGSVGRTVGEFDIREKDATLLSAFHILAVGFCIGFLLAFALIGLHIKCTEEKKKKEADKKKEKPEENPADILAPVASSESLSDPPLATNQPTTDIDIELMELASSSSN